MLHWLKIRNYLLIDQLEIQFSNGFVSITGETGAGKSVLIGAISLLTGKRADTSVLLDKLLKSVIEAGFQVKPLKLKAFFETNDLDYDEECIIRREITGQGKSRAFINDTPVRLELLCQLSEYLIDIHSQHQSLMLGTHGFQRNILDAVSETSCLRLEYEKVYRNYKQLDATIHEIEAKQKKALEEKDFLEFQLEQLIEAKLDSAELELLEQEEKLLSNAEDIKSALMVGVDSLQESEPSLFDAIREVEKQLENITAHYPKSVSYLERLQSVRIELQDVLSSCEQDADNVEYDPARLLEVQERINLLNALMQKFSVDNIEALIAERERIDSALQQFDMDNTKLDDLYAEREVLYLSLVKFGDELHKGRKSAIPSFQNQLKSMLADLGMFQANFEVQIEKLEVPQRDGLDRIDFLFSANPDLPANPIAKVASGGEMSRLMLCLKTVTAQLQQLPSIVFDEIDTGVSGEIAGRMGEMMNVLSQNSQVISITHLPQVAALADQQYHVVKMVNDGQTKVQLLQLSESDRIREIARMSSGKELTETAMQHAKDLLKIKT